jgi:hypothetical protein
MASSSCFVCKVTFCRGMVAVVLLGLCSGPVFAKAPELSAIEVYPTGDAQAYVQISGFTLNTKNEVHLCGGAQTIGKGNYGKLQKVVLEPGMSLERAGDGTLLLSRPGGAPECAVPGNVKNVEAGTPAQLADRAELAGLVQSASVAGTTSVPQLAKGVKIVLVSALDTELAEFLLAQRRGTISSWQSYLGKYPTGQHRGDAKAALSVLFVEKGRGELADYQASLKAAQPNYSKLLAAKSSLSSAMENAPRNAGTEALTQGIQQEATGLNSKGQDEIKLYQTALASQTSGYSHLVEADKLSQITLNLDQQAPETVALKDACKRERDALDFRFVDSLNKLHANRPDEAYDAIKPLRPFAPEYPRVQNALDAVYNYYLEQAKGDDDKDPQAEVSELKKAALVKPGPEIDAKIRDAEQKAKRNVDEAAVRSAMNMSQAAEDGKDYIKAYEVLDNLTPDQRKTATVAERMESLKGQFLPAALKKANEYQHTYIPIKGIGDERGVQHAYSLLISCDALSADPSLQDRISSLADSLSAYYLDQAKHYLAFPDGTGANIGYAYLIEALRYKGSNQGDVRAEMTRASAAYQLRSKLSIKVEFRDPTSRRETVNFIEQLTDSLATGLETSNPEMIKVVRPKDTPIVPPNFFLTGDVLQHTKSNNAGEPIVKSSKYSSGEHEVVTDEWTLVNRDYESAMQVKTSADAAYQGALARGKKNLIVQAKRQDEEAEQKVKALGVKLDNTPKNRLEQTERDYTYTERVDHLTATVELQFKIVDSTGSTVIPAVQIPNTESKTYSTRENVNPNDTMGVKMAGEVSTENDFMEDVEYGALHKLLKQAGETVAGLPALILQFADRKAADSDNDGAAEQYILYLNSTPNVDTPERRKAQKFLLENFNFRDYLESSPKA